MRRFSTTASSNKKKAFQNHTQAALDISAIDLKCWPCCNLSGGIVLIVWFTTNGMCVQNNTIMYVARTSNNRVILSGDLYCCLLLRCEALRTCRSGFPIATTYALSMLNL